MDESFLLLVLEGAAKFADLDGFVVFRNGIDRLERRVMKLVVSCGTGVSLIEEFLCSSTLS
jgi:hypothetical protein